MFAISPYAMGKASGGALEKVKSQTRTKKKSQESLLEKKERIKVSRRKKKRGGRTESNGKRLKKWGREKKSSGDTRDK